MSRSLAVAVAALAACAHAPPPVSLTLPRADTGAPFSVAGSRANATIVYFFTTWCVLCQAMEGAVAQAAAQGAPDGIQVVGIALDREGRRLIAPWVAATRPPYPVLVGGAEVAAGRTAFGPIPAVPTVLILDREGRPRQGASGLVTAGELLEAARKVAR